LVEKEVGARFAHTGDGSKNRLPGSLLFKK
jgi:hypothetical protein